MNKCYSRVEQILNTCIHFEEYKSKPLESYIYMMFSRESWKTGVDYELFKQLQIQYIIDKSYFNDLNTLI